MPINISPTGLARDLQTRADSGKPIRIGLVGSGEMGTDIVTRVAHMPGIEIGAISELRLPAAGKAVDIAYRGEGRGPAQQRHGTGQGGRHQ
jgi:predicted homoserine dehydrogenase-like protein